MDKINFNQTGGLPLTTNILNAMQNAYNIFNSLGSLAGNYTIISGCEQTGNNVGDGVVYINGELLPFKGGTKISRVRIVENIESKQFEDGQTKAVLFKRFVEFGTGVKSIPWGRFGRLNTIRSLSFDVPQLLKRVEELESRPTFHKGMVLLWNRPASEIPAGFREYTGLAGRVPVGKDVDYNYHTNDDRENYYLNRKGHMGGKREHKLTIEEMPKHSHKQGSESLHVLFGGGEYVGKRTYPGGEYNMYIKQNTNEVGGDRTHTNMQPYRVVEFIEYIGV